MKKAFHLLLPSLLFTLLLFTSCEKSKDTLLYGRWNVVKTDVCGDVVTYPNGTGDVYRFRSDHTYSITNKGTNVAEGEWEFNEEAGTLTLWSDPDNNISATYNVDVLEEESLILGFDFGFLFGEVELARDHSAQPR